VGDTSEAPAEAVEKISSEPKYQNQNECEGGEEQMGKKRKERGRVEEERMPTLLALPFLLVRLAVGLLCVLVLVLRMLPCSLEATRD
jgi:hypothetical protein